MRVGVPKEIKNREYRVGATPDCVRAYVKAGHTVLVQRGAGAGSGYDDDAYWGAGAAFVETAEELYGAADMIVKVKEPLPSEYPLLRPGQLLYAYLHLAAVPELARVLVERRVSALAYETIQLADRSLPCLVPMSAIAGRLSIQQGAKYLERAFGGRGVLLGGVPTVPPPITATRPRGTPLEWPSAWAPTSRSSTSRRGACTSWTICSPGGRRRWSRPTATWSACSRRPIW